MSITALGALSSASLPLATPQSGAQSSTSIASLTSQSANASSNSNKVTLADGSTVTTVRDKHGAIVTINTTPPTRPQSALATNSGPIDLLA
jgi:hypothetical protein